MATNIICFLAAMYIITRIFPIHDELKEISKNLCWLNCEETDKVVSRLIFLFCRNLLCLIPVVIILKNSIRLWG